MSKNFYIMDSYEISKEKTEIFEELSLEKYFNIIDGKWISNFVGFIIDKNKTIVSFPKHYYKNEDEINKEDFNILAELLVKTISSYKLNEEKNKYNNFPLRSYLYICNYYRKYGLYSETKNKKEKSYKGKIDWGNTIRRSNKIISGNNLIFLPFIVNKSITQEVFITECMIYVLNQGFNRFGKYFDIGVNINKKINNPIFNEKNIVIKQLSLLKSQYFKDSEIILIDNLISYFKWSNSNKDTTILLTKNFENYWEVMVEDFLNLNLCNVKNSGELRFKKNCKKYKFAKEKEKIESLKVREMDTTRKFGVEYDHLYIDLNDIAFLFDSKYYKEIQELNYKQMSYYYILKSSDKYSNKKIVNGLILPTESDYYFKIHLDTQDRGELLKGLFIVEHYLNVKKVIKSYVKYS